jgi:hypothetical protein
MIIAISGKKGSGKSTCSELFLQEGFYLDSFANTVKDVASLIFNFPRERLEGISESDRTWRETPDKDFSALLGRSFRPRDALTLIGTEFGRDLIHPNIWIKTLIDRYKIRQNANLVITDLRFENEFVEIKKLNAITIRINRNNIPKSEHISETALDQKDSEGEFDYYIQNDGSIEELKEKIKDIIKEIKAKHNVKLEP